MIQVNMDSGIAARLRELLVAEDSEEAVVRVREAKVGAG
jgi:hypothetical protein